MPPSFKLATLTLAVNAALITPVAAQAADEDLPLVTLPTITVTAETDIETADGPVQGIAASRVSSTTGFDESILKSTQSVTVVGQQEMETIGTNDMEDALGYVSGITAWQPSDKASTSYVIRGFRNFQNYYQDGQRILANSFDGPFETYGLERVEVIKGPNSLLNGAMPPGGTINNITKKPYFADGYEVNAEIGSFNRKQISADINQKLTDDIAVRLVGVYKNSDSFVNYVPDDAIYIAPSLTWQPSDATQLTLQADYHQINTKYITFLPAVGTLDTQYGKIARESFVGVPDFDKYDNERYTIGYKISHKVTPELKIEHNLRRMKVDVDMPRVFWDRAVDENNDIYSRSSQKRRDASEVTTSGLSAQYDWSVGDNFDNVSLVGIDYSDTSQETERYNGTSTNINLLNPDHSQDSISDEFTAYPYSGRQDSKQTGIYAQNQLTFNDKITALIGIRHDKVEGVETAIFEPKTSTSGDYSATTGRIGLVYLMDSGVAPYASVSQSFDVETGKDRNGNLFEPTRGEQYEIGVRYQPEGSDTLLTGVLYRIDQTDVLVADPNNSAFDYFKIQLGEVRSQGVELEARTQLGDNSNLIIAYDYTDARTIKPSPLYPEEEGKRKGEVPYNTFSLWSDYRFTDFGMPNLKMGVGLRFKDNTLLLSDESEVPSYTLVDAMASYDWSNNMKLSLNIKNLFDEDSIVCVYDCNYIEPRNIVGKVTYKW